MIAQPESVTITLKESNPKRFCVNCKHCVPSGLLFKSIKKAWCHHPYAHAPAPEFDLVTGKAIPKRKVMIYRCEDERTGSEPLWCGKSGRFYTPEEWVKSK